MNDVWIIVRWYLASLVLQIIGLGLIQPLFNNWKDKGYGVARLIGLVATSIPLWFLSSLHIVPFNDVTVIIFTVILLAIAIWLLIKYKFNFSKYMLIQEISFVVIYVIWDMIRSTNAQVEGTEKFMNIAFMNSINRSEYFPPNDPWYAGSSINYYYLGHYIYTFFAKLAGVTVAYAYNLSLNTIIAQTFIGTISILGEITGLAKKHFKLSLLLGFFVAAWLCFGSNLHYLWSWVDQVLIKHQEFSYWFPDGTRIIPFAIDEFPAYSITLGDLHGHFMGLPMVTIFIALLFVSFKTSISSRKKVIMNLFISLLLFSLYGINSWDFITVNFMFLLLHFYQALTLKAKWQTKVTNFIMAEVALILPGIPLILPFFLQFKPAVSGLGVVPLSAPREFIPYLQMWGMFLLINIFGIITLIVIPKLKKTNLVHETSVLVSRNHNAIFAFLLCFTAVCLILGVEIFYVRDIFEKDNGAYFRTNTVFKFYFAAWNIWAIGSGYIIYAVFKAIYNNPWKFAFPFLASFSAILVITWIGSIAYIFEAVDDFYSWGDFVEGGNFKVAGLIEGKNPQFYKTLDGNDYIKVTGEYDYPIIQWLNNNINGTPVILEAVGDAYTYYSRISTNTGLPTVMGWPTHQWQWRNTIKDIYERKDNVEKIYTTTSEDEFVKLTDQYAVDYIIFSDLEIKTYGKTKKINVDLIEKYYEEVFNSEGRIIYRYKNLK